MLIIPVDELTFFRGVAQPPTRVVFEGLRTPHAPGLTAEDAPTRSAEVSLQRGRLSQFAIENGPFIDDVY